MAGRLLTCIFSLCQGLPNVLLLGVPTISFRPCLLRKLFFLGSCFDFRLTRCQIKIDHRNDIAVNIFGLVMSIVGDRFVWYLDPIGAICIALLILFSWVSNAFEQVWLLVGKSAPQEFVSKLVYMSMTHDSQITKVDTVSFSPHFCAFLFFFSEFKRRRKPSSFRKAGSLENIVNSFLAVSGLSRWSALLRRS